MKVMVFIDYWNLQLTFNQGMSRILKTDDYRGKINWKQIGTIFLSEACNILNVPESDASYEGCHIYT
jgi:hypothetical protein